MKWALMGAAGYVAPRHMRAIQDTGGTLVAAVDPHDSVGILDRYAPGCAFYTDVHAFWRHLDRHAVDAVAVCTPNDLHWTHAMGAMHRAPLVLCEKPLALTPRHMDAYQRHEERTGSRLATVLQLRQHPKAKALRALDHPATIHVTYTSVRGPWYHTSWKGDARRSGGILMNIGIHVFDLLLWAFGVPNEPGLVHVGRERATGVFRTGPTLVHWTLATDADSGTQRTIVADGQAVSLTGGFTGLHTEVYRRTLAGDGVGVEDARPAVEFVHAMRQRARETVAA